MPAGAAILHGLSGARVRVSRFSAAMRRPGRSGRGQAALCWTRIPRSGNYKVVTGVCSSAGKLSSQKAWKVKSLDKELTDALTAAKESSVYSPNLSQISFEGSMPGVPARDADRVRAKIAKLLCDVAWRHGAAPFQLVARYGAQKPLGQISQAPQDLTAGTARDDKEQRIEFVPIEPNYQLEQLILPLSTRERLLDCIEFVRCLLSYSVPGDCEASSRIRRSRSTSAGHREPAKRWQPTPLPAIWGRRSFLVGYLTWRANTMGRVRRIWPGCSNPLGARMQ